MERPLCPLCGHKHYSYEPHVWGSEENAPKEPDKEQAGEQEAGSLKTASGKKVLTPAEKQKAYRERLGEEYRRRNRERMRKARMK